MDRVMVEDHLAMAERHVAEGERHISRQRELIVELANDSHDVTAAEKLLKTFEEMQVLHVADRDRLRAELEAME